MIRRCEKRTISGSIDAPASKSSMQRAVACATLAGGTSLLKSGELCADSKSALRLATTLGAAVSIDGSIITIEGSALFGGIERRSADCGASPASSGSSKARGVTLELDCGESGLCMRMFSPIAAILDMDTRLVGQGSLLRRPMGMVEGPIRAMGAECRSSGGFAPLFIRGPLRGGRVEMDSGESSQLLTGLLIALPLAKEDSELRVSNAVSKGYLDLTIDTCAAFGVRIERNEDFSVFSIEGGQTYRAREFTVEGDWSGAAFLVVAAAIAAKKSELAIRGLRKDSSQPDRAILSAALAAGATLRVEGDAFFVGRGRLDAFEFDATDCPDLFPPLAALASACGGISEIRGIHRLKGKESDRAASLKATFEALGARVSFDGDYMLIEGCSIHGGEIDARGDHRIAMAAAVAALNAKGSVTILGSECVAKSWPGFFEDLESISL